MNRRILLARRPEGVPVPDDFKTVQEPVPTAGPGQVLFRTLYLSLDPYMRGRMSDAPSYVEPVALGDVMCGQVVGRVVQSNDARFKADDLVLANTGWQEHGIAIGDRLTRLDPSMSRPSYALGVLGMPGMTAYVGLLDIGQPKAGETLVVAAATGAVGSVVGQIGKMRGCRVVGVAGGSIKCACAVDTLGFDACIDHHAIDFAQQLAQACPKGIDIYFENVGGAVLEAVLPLLNIHARIPVCGLVAYYSMKSSPAGPDRTPAFLRTVLVRRVKVQGFIIFDHYQTRQGDFIRDMSAWIREGKMKYREQIVQGLENAPQAFIGMLHGDNFGKLVIKVADDQSAAA